MLKNLPQTPESLKAWSWADFESLYQELESIPINENNIDLPFYYVEYGLAQLGAIQIFGNALKDQAGAVADYRKALAFGGTVT